MSSIKKNLGLQTAYQVLSACMPLITAPYLARKLGATQLGVFSYTSSIVAYFTLVAMLGTVNYGTRSIASAGDDRKHRNEVFSGIYILQIVVTLVAIVAYALYLILICKNNKTIALIQGIALLSCLFDINWLFFGVENFQITVTRNFIIKIATVVSILLFVKKESDLWIYTLIMLGGTLLSNIVLYAYLPRYASLVKVPINQIKKHLLPNLILFIPLLAMSVYHTMDKTMLGWLSTFEQSGFYYNSDKIVQIPLVIVNGIGTVMLPRMSALLSQNKKKEANKLFIMTLEGVAVMSIALACGIVAIANEFIPLFYGQGYDDCIVITKVLAPLLLIKGFSAIVRTQYLIPMQMEKEFTKSVVGGAIINLLLNILLIPNYGAMGASIATVVAELVACILQFYSLRGEKLGIWRLISKTIVYILIGLIMVCIVRLSSLLEFNMFFKIIIEILVGVICFCSLCVVYWCKTNNELFRLLVNPITRRIRK